MESFVDKIYPHLNNNFVSDITNQFNLGKLISWEGIPGGWSNVNVKVKTSTGTFIIRFYRFGARTVDDISLEFSVLEKLKQAGLSVAPAISTKNGEKLLTKTLDNKKTHIVAFEYIEGEEVSQLNQDQLQLLGETLAQIHDALDDFSISYIRKYWHFKFEIWKFKKTILKRANSRPWVFGQNIALFNFVKLVENEMKNFSKFFKKYKQVLAADSLIHGDFHLNNLKFKNNTIVGIFDFGSLLYGPRILDLAICIANLKLQTEERDFSISLKKITDSIKMGYQKKIKLTADQQKVLPYLVRFWLVSQFAWVLKSTKSESQAHFYQQVFSRLLKVLKE